MTGYIRLHRSLFENELYFSERFTRALAWIDLLLLARHRPGTVSIRGIEIPLEVGELCYSMESLAERWKWNRRTVANFLSMLSRRQMIHTRKSNVTTVVSILNYSRYQADVQQSAQQSSSRVHTNKNDKNGEKRTPPVSAGTMSPTSCLIAFFCSEHEQRCSSKYSVLRGRDHAAAKGMIDSLGLEECKARVVRYFVRRDPWNLAHGFSIHNMAQVINGLGPKGNGAGSMREVTADEPGWQ